MNILLALPALNRGGVESHAKNLARGLSTQGHSVVVMSSGGKGVENLKDISGVNHVRLNIKRKSLVSGVPAIYKMSKFIKKRDIDVVHAHSRVPAWIGFAASRITGTPFVTTAHSYYSVHLGSSIMARGKRVIAVSSGIRDYLTSSYSIEKEHVEVIHPGINISLFADPGEPAPLPAELKNRKKGLILGNVARLTESKGHEYLLRAFAHLKNEISNSHSSIANSFLIIVGGGNRIDKLQLLAKDLDIFEDVFFLGYRDDIPALLNLMDVFILSSTSEGFGLAAVEAMAAKKPVLMTRCGGISEMIDDGKHVMLVPQKDYLELAAGLINLIKNKNIRTNLAAQGHEFVRKNFSLKEMARKHIQVYREVE